MRSLEQAVPEVSIILTAYNCESFLPRTIQSVLGQSFEDWELLAVDDASTDRTRHVIERFARTDGRVRPIFRDVNAGLPAVGRNEALGVARGRWVAILDGDDLWHREKLKRQIEALALADSEFCSTRVFNFRDDHEVTLAGVLPREQRAPERIRHRRLMLGNMIIASSVLVSRRILKAEPFNPTARYRGIEDFDCWLRIHRNQLSSSIQLKEPLTYYRQLRGSLSSSKVRMARRRLSLYYDHLEGSQVRFAGVGLYSLTNLLVASLRRLRDGRRPPFDSTAA